MNQQIQERKPVSGEVERSNIEDEIANCARILALWNEFDDDFGDFWTEEVGERGCALLSLPIVKDVYSEENWDKSRMRIEPPPPVDEDAGRPTVEWTRSREEVTAAAGFVAEMLHKLWHVESPHGLNIAMGTVGFAATMIEEIERHLKQLFLELGKILNQEGDRLVMGEVDLFDYNVEQWREEYEAAQRSEGPVGVVR